MTVRPSHVKFTYEDYLLFPNDGRRHELIDGDHFVTPAPKTKHQRISQNLSGLFYAYLTQTKAGRLFCAPTDVILSDLDIVQPDLLFVSTARASIITEDNIQGPPDLVVEILSESTRRADELIKRKLYERYGVPEYWIVDPDLDTVKVYRLTGERYHRVAELDQESGDILTSPLLPDFQVSLSALFE